MPIVGRGVRFKSFNLSSGTCSLHRRTSPCSTVMAAKASAKAPAKAPAAQPQPQPEAKAAPVAKAAQGQTKTMTKDVSREDFDRIMAGDIDVVALEAILLRFVAARKTWTTFGLGKIKVGKGEKLDAGACPITVLDASKAWPNMCRVLTKFFKGQAAKLLPGKWLGSKCWVHAHSLPNTNAQSVFVEALLLQSRQS